MHFLRFIIYINQLLIKYSLKHIDKFIYINKINKINNIKNNIKQYNNTKYSLTVSNLLRKNRLNGQMMK